MSPALQMAAGLFLTLAGWLADRIVARAPLRWSAALPLDLFAPLVLWSFLFAAVARPIAAGTAIFALFAALALVDWGKREALIEPVVFSDMSEFVELFRHPELYVPFIGAGIVAAAVAAAAVAIGTPLWLEPGLWPWSPWPGLIAAGVLVALGAAVSRPPLLAWLAALFRRFAPSGDPLADATRLGPLAMLLVHGTIARAERPARRAQARPVASPLRPAAAGAPVLLVQCESFFDARRLHDAVPTALLPRFERCCAEGLLSGRLAVPAWGANTPRTEFATLTGLDDRALGFDRFHPYHAFARVPIASLAWRLRALGYRTICLHPYDRRFYRRDKVLPNLGFDRFLGEEAFAGAQRSGPYIADGEVARVAAELLREEGPRLFLFAITMENHGPWLARDPRRDGPHPAPELAREQPGLTEGDALKAFLKGLESADGMLGVLAEALAERHPDGFLGFYGDHLPSLPGCFAELGHADPRTDYVLWRPRGGDGERRDLRASELGEAIWQLLPAASARSAA